MATQTRYASSVITATNYANGASAYTDNGVYAVFSSTTRNATAALYLGIAAFAIPTGATINSVTVYMDRKWSSGASSLIDYAYLQAAYSGATRGTRYNDTAFPTSDTPASTNAGSWTVAELNSGSMQVNIDTDRKNTTSSTTHSVDVVYVTADYTEAAQQDASVSAVIASAAASGIPPVVSGSSGSGGGNVTYVGKSAIATSLTDLTVSVPAGYAEGDLLLLVVDGFDTQPTTPSGWTNIAQQSSTWRAYLNVSYKIAGASESPAVVPDITDGLHGVMLAFRNPDTSGPINAYSQGASSGTSYTAQNGLTTTVDNCMVVTCVGFYDADEVDTDNYYDVWVNASLDFITEEVDAEDGTASGGGVAVAYGIKSTAGAVSPTTATADTSANYSASVMVAIAPGAASSGDAEVTAVIASATATGVAPTVTASGTVTAAQASAVASAVAPAISTSVSVLAAPPIAAAEGMASSVAGAAGVTAVPVEATACGVAPSISASGSVTVNAIPANVVAEGLAVAVTASGVITLEAAAAVASAIAPDASTTDMVTIAADCAAATAFAISPPVSGCSSVAAAPAEASASGIGPTVSASAIILILAGSATASANTPSAGTSLSVIASIAQAVADALVVTVSISAAYKQLIAYLSTTDNAVTLGQTENVAALSVRDDAATLSQADNAAALTITDTTCLMGVEYVSLMNNTVRLSAEFRDFAGELVSPTGVVLRFYDRNMIQIGDDIAVVPASTGIYQYDYTLPTGVKGTLYYEFAGTLDGKTILGRSMVRITLT